MQLNHCVNADISLPVALVVTASGMPPTPPVAKPEAAGGERGSEKEGIIGAAAEEFPLAREMAALRQTHSSNWRLGGGDDTDT